MRIISSTILLVVLVGGAASAGASGSRIYSFEQAGQKGQPAATPPDQKDDKKDDKKAEDCGCDAKTPPDVLAVVNELKISLKEIDDPIAQQVSDLRKQVTEARKRATSVLINTRLLAAEAKRRGLTNNQFLEQEIGTKIKD